MYSGAELFARNSAARPCLEQTSLGASTTRCRSTRNFFSSRSLTTRRSSKVSESHIHYETTKLTPNSISYR